MPLLEVEGIYAHYHYAPVLQGISLQLDAGEILSGRPAPDPQLLIAPVRLGNRPGAPIEPADPGGARRGECPGRAGRTGSAAQIQNLRALTGSEFLDDVGRGLKMKGSVEQREGGPLARAFESGALSQARSPLDIARRERPQRPANFRHRQVGEVPLVERLDPVLEERLRRTEGHEILVTA